MTALEAIRAKKRSGQRLMAWELVIWEAHRKGADEKDEKQIALAENAANEVAKKDLRIFDLEAAMENMS